MSDPRAGQKLAELRWRGLYRAAACSGLLVAALVLFAVIGWFIWPHVFGELDAEQVLLGLQRAPLVFVMKLDPVVLVATIAQLPLFLGLWAALRPVSDAWSTTALALGAVAVAALLPSRPIVELFALSAEHAAARDAAQRALQVAAAQALLAGFHGTGWAVGVLCGGAAGTIWSALMLRTPHFGRATAWVGIAAGVGSMLFFLPKIGILLLFLLGTLGAIVWCVLVARDLTRLSASLTHTRADDTPPTP